VFSGSPSASNTASTPSSPTAPVARAKVSSLVRRGVVSSGGWAAPFAEVVRMPVTVSMVGCVAKADRHWRRIGGRVWCPRRGARRLRVVREGIPGHPGRPSSGQSSKEIEDGLLWPQPWLALNPVFESGGTVGELVDRGAMHPKARSIFRARASEDDLGEEIALHRHQTDAFEIANRRESYVLTTGTGSGKSMSYIVPIVDRVLREGGKGVRAIVVYPMNALANSQLIRHRDVFWRCRFSRAVKRGWARSAAAMASSMRLVVAPSRGVVP
jgi:DEAD/DEAH box helicase